MVNVTLAIPEELKLELQKHSEVNWSAVIRKALAEHLRKVRIAETIASKSKLTKEDVKELDEMIKRGIANNHGIR